MAALTDVSSDIMSILSVLVPLVMSRRKKQKIIQHDCILTGQLYYSELMSSENSNRFLNVARMDKRTFEKLLSHLRTDGQLEDSLFICAGQKLMILLTILIGASNRQAMERWQHSGSTIFRYRS